MQTSLKATSFLSNFLNPEIFSAAAYSHLDRLLHRFIGNQHQIAAPPRAGQLPALDLSATEINAFLQFGRPHSWKHGQLSLKAFR